MNRLIAALKAIWVQIPHSLQALIISSGTAVATSFAHALFENNCATIQCIKHYAVSALLAGAAVWKAFYMIPSSDQQKAQAIKEEKCLEKCQVQNSLIAGSGSSNLEPAPIEKENQKQ